MKNLTNKIAVTIIVTGLALFCAASSFAMEEAGIDIHGFVSQGFLKSNEYNYLTHDSKDGSFQYNEMAINFGKSLTDKLRIGVQLFSRDLGDVSNNKVTLDWAFGDYRFQDWMGFRAGRIKLPVGFYNETRDVDFLRTSIVMPQSVYPDLLRDTVIAVNGAGMYGNIAMAGAGSLDYQILVGQMNVDNDSGFQKYYDSRFKGIGATLNGESDPDISWVGSLRWNTPVDGWALGISAMITDAENHLNVASPLYNGPASQEVTYTTFVFSTEYLWNDLTLAAEYLNFKTESNILGHEDEVTSQGYYVSGSYRFSELLSLGLYYSIYYPNKDDKDGDTYAHKADAWEKDLALTLRFDINEYIVFKLEGHMVDGTARATVDNPIRKEDDFTYGAAKVTFSF